MPIGTPGGQVTTEVVFRNGVGAGLPVTDVAVVIKDLDDNVIHGPITTIPPIVQEPSTGHFSYAWAVGIGVVPDDYVALWTAVWLGSPVGPGAEDIEIVPGGLVSSGDYTFDTATTVGKLRVLVQDTDLSSIETATPLRSRSAFFTDADLQVFLDLMGSDLLLAAGSALRSKAASPQLHVISRRNGKGQVEYGQLRADLLKLAGDYEKRAMETPADAVVDVDYNDFTFRQILDNAAMRQEL